LIERIHSRSIFSNNHPNWKAAVEFNRRCQSTLRKLIAERDALGLKRLNNEARDEVDRRYARALKETNACPIPGLAEYTRRHIVRLGELMYVIAEEVDFKAESLRIDRESLMLQIEDGLSDCGLNGYQLETKRGQAGLQGRERHSKGREQAKPRSVWSFLPKLRTELNAAEALQKQVHTSWKEYDKLEQSYLAWCIELLSKHVFKTHKVVQDLRSRVSELEGDIATDEALLDGLSEMEEDQEMAIQLARGNTIPKPLPAQ